MPCCKLCNSIQTASIIGRIIVAFSAIGILIGFLRMVITLITGAIFQAVMAGILIFGAQHRNRTALLFWMFVTILELIVTTTFLAIVLIVLIDPDFLRYVLYPYVFGCSFDATKQEMVLNFELVVSDQLFSVALVAYK